MRVCSLIPGATEVVAALGFADNLVAISHACDFPPDIQHKPVVVKSWLSEYEGTSRIIDLQVKQRLASGEPLYDLDAALFHQSQPDAIIAQDLCQVCAITPDQLRQAMARLPSPPTLLSLGPMSLEQVLQDIGRIGEFLGCPAAAATYTQSRRDTLQSLSRRAQSALAHPRVVCLEWLDPLYSAGHWIPDMVHWAGGIDCLGKSGEASHVVRWEDIRKAEPEVVVFMPCGFSADRTKHELEALADAYSWSDLPACRAGKMFAVEAGSYFSRPGPRLVEGVEIFASIFHPELGRDLSRYGTTVLSMHHA